ncbi:secretin N-terminal domain-containing protein [Viridibacterium curvum]|uniref:Tetratricopeptide repeat protein n=1 Tax=Viridibacterium curvum TaxID=1101404 RepID=A0ABP9QLC8_9RHOO
MQAHRLLSTLLALLLLNACATSPLEASRKLAEEGQPEAALKLLVEAMKESPSDQNLRIQYYRLRDGQVNRAISAAERARQGGQTAEARRQVALALRMDPGSSRAIDLNRALDDDADVAEQLKRAETLLDGKKYSDAEALARDLMARVPNHSGVRQLLRRLDTVQQPASAEVPGLRSQYTKPVTLEFRDTALRGVFEAISRTAGVNFVFDRDVRADTKVTVFVRNVMLDEAIRMVLVTNGLDRKMFNENSMLIYPANAAKQREHQDLVTRTFYLTNTDVKQAQTLVKTVVKTRDIFIDEKLNVMVIKDSAEAVRLAERLVAQIDIPDPEVMLDVEVLEVLRSRLINVGLQFPEQIGYGLLQPTTASSTVSGSIVTSNTTLGGQLQAGNINLRNTGQLVPYVPNPGLLLNLKDRDSDSNILANPRIRVRNREKAKIHIGDKLPVFTTTSTANVGVSATVNYLDVGLKFDVEPIVRLDDEVEIKVGLEVSSVVKEVTGPQSSLAYQIGTRNTSTVLRLRDGETQVLAGLISDEERSSAAHVPAIGRIPLLGRLFSNNNDSNTKTEIVLLITPRVLRNIQPNQTARASLAAGTDSSIGSEPLRISNTAARAIDVRGGQGATGNAAARAAQRAPGEEPPPNATVQRVTITLGGPREVRAGQEAVVIITANASSALRSADVALNWDPSLFETVGDGGGTVPLTVNGGVATGQLRLRAKAAGTARIEIGTASFSNEAGDVPTTTPEPLEIKVVP